MQWFAGRGLLCMTRLCFQTVVCSQSGPEISGACNLVTSATDSLEFTWQSAMSATSYRLVGDRVNKTSDTNSITVNNLTPGSRYSFTVRAVSSEGLVSNSISCTNSTGLL